MNDGLQDWLISPRGAIRRERVEPHEAFARWQAHRAAFERTRLWPVIVPIDDQGLLEASFADQAAGVEDVIAMGVNLSVADFFSGILEDVLEEGDEEASLDLDFDPADLLREAKPPVEAQSMIANDSGYASGRKGGLGIALVPCRAPWEVPAVLGYGGWNACPMPAEHVAVLREWHRRHGAEPLAIGHDTVELLVRPIESPEEAKRTAIEQYAYCSDIVDQGVGSIRDLASDLWGSSVWFFWWD